MRVPLHHPDEILIFRGTGNQASSWSTIFVVTDCSRRLTPCVRTFWQEMNDARVSRVSHVFIVVYTNNVDIRKYAIVVLIRAAVGACVEANARLVLEGTAPQ